MLRFICDLLVLVSYKMDLDNSCACNTQNIFNNFYLHILSVYLRDEGCVTVERPVTAATGTLAGAVLLVVLSTLSLAVLSCTCLACLQNNSDFNSLY